ncbi:MAG: aggregation factor core [Pseudomonadota bacterium]
MASASVNADIAVRFIESAPKDRFEVHNTTDCLLQDVELAIDLQGSAGKLYFDTTAEGAGVEVFQPFESAQAGLTLASSDKVRDGETSLRVQIAKLEQGAKASFTIDVDDALTDSSLGQIRVADSEMSGAGVTFSAQNVPSVSGQFDGDTVTLPVAEACATQ